MTDQLQLSVTVLDKLALEEEVGSDNLTAAQVEGSLEYREPGTILVLVAAGALSGLVVWLAKPKHWSRDIEEVTRTLPNGEVLTYRHDRRQYREESPSPGTLKAIADAIKKALKLS